MPWLALALGAGAGLLKHVAVDKPMADKQRTLAASTQRYSPWTGLQAQPVKEPNALGSALTFGQAGAQLQQGIESADAQNDWLKRGGSPAAPANMSISSSPWNLRGRDASPLTF